MEGCSLSYFFLMPTFSCSLPKTKVLRVVRLVSPQENGKEIHPHVRLIGKWTLHVEE